MPQWALHRPRKEHVTVPSLERRRLHGTPRPDHDDGVPPPAQSPSGRQSRESMSTRSTTGNSNLHTKIIPRLPFRFNTPMPSLRDRPFHTKVGIQMRTKCIRMVDSHERGCFQGALRMRREAGCTRDALGLSGNGRFHVKMPGFRLKSPEFRRYGKMASNATLRFRGGFAWFDAVLGVAEGRVRPSPGR